MTTTTRIITNFTCLLFAILCLSASIVTSFNPSHPGLSAPTKTAISSDSAADATTPPIAPEGISPVEGAAAAAVTPASPPVVVVEGAAASSDAATSPAKQSDFGTTLELPSSYASCGQCGAAFALTEEAMGPAKGGRRMECSVCSHTWFQSRERLGRVGDGFEMITLPDRDLERIQLNIKEGKHPKHFGDYKMYVGNISFQCTEEDLFNKFSEIGPVGDVSMVRDNDGRIRGFGFITMRNVEDGERALELLDGTDLKGRTLNVRPSTN